MVFNNIIYGQIKSGNFDQDQGEIGEKSGNFISHSEWELRRETLCDVDWCHKSAGSYRCQGQDDQ